MNLLIILFLIISFIINILILFQKKKKNIFNSKTKQIEKSKNNIDKIIIFLISIFFLVNLLIVNLNTKIFKNK